MSLRRLPLKTLKVSRWILVFLLALLLCLIRTTTPTLAATTRIVPGTPWSDSSGREIQAHGEGITQVGSTYYWFGEDKTNESSGNAYFQNVPCYSSTDLVHWTFVQNVLTKQSSGDLGPNRIIERPKVIYNDSTHQYVMYMHVDTSNYGAALVGVATSSSICGTYTYHGSFQPLGNQSRDMGLFKDSDGTGYLLTEDRANGLRIDKLSADYLSVVSSVALFADYEAPALFRANGRYYLLASHLTGWNTNDNQYTSATSLSGPWSAWSNFAPSGTNTFNSQTTFVLPITGSQGTTYIYMGDRWNPADLGDSPYVWQPIQFSGNNLSISWHNSWSLNVAAGTWQDQGTAYYKLVNRNSGKVLDVSNASTTAGAAIDQWTDNGGASQQWNLSAPGYGFYDNLINNHSGQLLDVANGATTDGAAVIQWTSNGGNNQQWSIVSVDNGLYYKLVNRNSGKVLDVANNSTAAGASVDQWTDNGGSNQQWSLILI
ncbi:RICIN domain-containing protein [Dictyobacter arantiisoli]|uniref:Glycoside hydrolase n=1 Tax=Dictyobacter arantiisoli TaxID=2014874 RepID=A0A5A5TEE7_9CHLR|nr:RICIN domain-containing protein [Dictyobacter arantiisoli]GCF09931.1 glycoside hydrolase [Dictyobacter arantiisoli]